MLGMGKAQEGIEGSRMQAACLASVGTEEHMRVHSLAACFDRNVQVVSRGMVVGIDIDAWFGF